MANWSVVTDRRLTLDLVDGHLADLGPTPTCSTGSTPSPQALHRAPGDLRLRVEGVGGGYAGFMRPSLWGRGGLAKAGRPPGQGMGQGGGQERQPYDQRHAPDVRQPEGRRPGSLRPSHWLDVAGSTPTSWPASCGPSSTPGPAGRRGPGCRQDLGSRHHFTTSEPPPPRRGRLTDLRRPRRPRHLDLRGRPAGVGRFHGSWRSTFADDLVIVELIDSGRPAGLPGVRPG